MDFGLQLGLGLGLGLGNQYFCPSTSSRKDMCKDKCYRTSFFKGDNLTFSRETISMINIRIMDVT